MAYKYWVGNGGNWSDTAHWSLSSGGSGGAGVPTLTEPVIFDRNSFTTTGQTVVVNNSVCKTAGLDFSDLDVIFTLQFNDSLYIFNGNAILSPLITCTSARFGFYFASGECSLTTNSCVVPDIMVNYWTYGGATSAPTLVLLDTVICTYNFNVSGSLTTNSNSITALRDITFYSDALSVLLLGSSAISCEWFTDYNTSSAASDYGTSTITCTYAFEAVCEGSNRTYYNIIFAPDRYSTFHFYGSISCESLTIHSGFSSIYFDASWPEDDPVGPSIEVYTSIAISGTVECPLYTYSGWEEEYDWILTKNSGTVSIENVVLNNSIAQGGATFYALTSNGCIDGGGNTGWIFEPTIILSISSFSPSSGYGLDKIKISGTGFSEYTSVKIGEVECEVDSFTDENIIMSIPYEAETNLISVYSETETAYSSEQLIINQLPIIRLQDDLTCENLIIKYSLDSQGYKINSRGVALSPISSIIDIQDSDISCLTFQIDDKNDKINGSSNLLANIIIEEQLG